MTTKLAPLRSNLESLRRRRTLARLTTAYSGFLAAAVWIVLVSFLLDWSFAMDRPQRVVLLLLGVWSLLGSGVGLDDWISIVYFNQTQHL